jgi:hypothetical protein
MSNDEGGAQEFMEMEFIILNKSSVQQFGLKGLSMSFSLGFLRTKQ